MSVIIFVLIPLIWLLILHYKKDKVFREEENQSKEFWNREREANDIRKKDISTLPYLQIELDKLPLRETGDEQLSEYQETVRQLSEKKIINLSRFSNTDLKMQYGPSNLEKLSEYDCNYTTLIRTLSLWGNYLYQQGAIEDSQSVLEYGISCNTDIKLNYVLLAQIYRDSNETEKLNALTEKVRSLDTLLKASILASLKTIQNS